MSQPKIIVLGAGPTGLGAALRLEDLGHTNWKLFDPEIAGGLARSFVDDHGFTWDIGGHVIFSHYKYFDDAMDYSTEEWLHHERESWVRVEGVWVPYPFQNNIHRLPPAAKAECLSGLVDVYRKEFEGKPANFDEYFSRQMGDGISKVFMRPYNFKVWAVPPKMMSTEWMGERVATVNLKLIAENVCLNKDTLGWGPNNTFRFPLHGGTGGIWTRLADKLPKERLLCGKANHRVTKVDAGKKTLTFIDGTTETYDYLLTTIPFDDAIRIIDGPFDTKEWPEIADKMVYSATNVVGIGLKGTPPPHLRTMCWMYFPEDNCPFYRVTVFSNYSPKNAPEGCWSLMLEISESVHKPVNQETLMEECVQGCINADLLKPEDLPLIVSKWHRRFPKGYPTPFVGRNELLMKVQPTLKAHQIYSRGRFGGWKYEVANQDHSMMQGVEAIDDMLGKAEEITYWAPDTVNTRKNDERSLSLLKK
jgi:protoporphyrinogen oxidase